VEHGRIQRPAYSSRRGHFPVSSGGVAFWDSEVSGLLFVTSAVVSLQTQRTQPVLLVEATLYRDGFLLVSANVPYSQRDRYARLRAAQEPMAARL
jgi:hypothetical protein